MTHEPLTDAELIDLFVRAKKLRSTDLTADPLPLFTPDTVLRLLATIARDRAAVEEAGDPFGAMLRRMGLQP